MGQHQRAALAAIVRREGASALHGRAAAELLARLNVARADSLALIRGLASEDWARRGSMRGTGTSLLDLGTWLANHDRGHLAQVRRLCGKGAAGAAL